jgi:hypothetical protein
VPSIDEIAAVAAVRRHLLTNPRPAVEIDARFRGRVLVRGRVS